MAADADAVARTIAAARTAGAIRAADEGELALTTWERTAGRAADARKRLAVLETDARARGALRVANRARQLGR